MILRTRREYRKVAMYVPSTACTPRSGATDALAFEVYVEHFLAQTLSEGQVVVFDNLGAHKSQRIKELIEARGAQVLFLPSYSPDLNPIEEAFSKIKQLARKTGARTREALL